MPSPHRYKRHNNLPQDEEALIPTVVQQSATMTLFGGTRIHLYPEVLTIAACWTFIYTTILWTLYDTAVQYVYGSALGAVAGNLCLYVLVHVFLSL
jgi:hypothetical protein